MEPAVASRTSNTLTLASSAAACGILTLQVWQTGANAFTVGVVALLATTNIAFIATGFRSGQHRISIGCPEATCSVRIDLTGVAQAEQDRLIALATDHSRHGGTR